MATDKKTAAKKATAKRAANKASTKSAGKKATTKSGPKKKKDEEEVQPEETTQQTGEQLPAQTDEEPHAEYSQDDEPPEPNADAGTQEQPASSTAVEEPTDIGQRARDDAFGNEEGTTQAEPATTPESATDAKPSFRFRAFAGQLLRKLFARVPKKYLWIGGAVILAILAISIFHNRGHRQAMKEDRKAQKEWDVARKQWLADSTKHAAQEKYWDSVAIAGEVKSQFTQDQIAAALNNSRLTTQQRETIQITSKKKTDEFIAKVFQTVNRDSLKHVHDSLIGARHAKGWPD